MRLPNGEFAWGLGDNSTTDFTVRTFKAFARRMYQSYMGDLADTNVFDKQLYDRLVMMQDRLVASGKLVPGKFTRGVLDLETEYGSGFKVRPAPEPVCVYYSMGGAGSTWNQGYCYDIGETLDKSKVWHQPIGFDTRPIPMNRGVQTGITELIRQLDMPRGSRGLTCTTLPWMYGFYSMGALAGMAVVDRVLHGDLDRFKATYQGGYTFGNPRRQNGHSFPGCLNSSGEGIATPTDHDMPDVHWDFAASKDMPGSGGDDLYTKMADDENARTVRNMRAVWDIINKGNPLSLTAAILLLLAHPTFQGGWDAAAAAIKALNFFVVKQTGPHVHYGTTLPIANDSRDCWELARAHTADLVARVPRLMPPR
jgi:hypothetical protein